MLSEINKFLNSPNAIAVACIGSLFVTSTTVDDMIHRPIQSTFWPLVWGGLAGSWVSSYTPEGLTPCVAGSIIGVTLTGLLARHLGYKLKLPERNWVDVTLKIVDYFDFKNGSESRLSYNAHELFPDKGVILETNNTLTPEMVNAILANSIDKLDEIIYNNLLNITNALNKAKSLHKISSVFIHDNHKGYVMLNGPEKQGPILSVKI